MRKLLIVLAVICLVPLSFVLAVLVHHNVVDTSDYNYNHFAASQYHHGTFSGPQVGEPAIDFALYDTDGNRHALSDYRGQYVVIETGSLTCPQYISRIEPMTSLQAAHPEVTFLTLYVREAHPGSKIARHERYEDKTALASRVQLEEPETRTILVDELAGPVHQSYGAWPNMVYIIDP
ncbi:MAG: deiodinase-like protein, partial [Pseudomonadota bacterium]